MKPVFPLLLAALVATLPLRAWGDAGHRVVAGLSLRTLPPQMAPWFEGQEAFVREHASDPDRWKAHDRKEGPRHYIDVEIYGRAEDIPRDVQAAMRLLGPKAFQKAGLAPWIIQDRLRDLVEAFKARDRRQVVFLTAVLGHYVADVHVPLHCARNHNGQESGQRGVHARWESGLLERFLREDELQARPAERERGLYEAPWRWVAESNALMPALLDADREADRTTPVDGQRPRRGTAYWMVFWNRQGDTLKLQLERAAQRTGQLVRYAWELAGAPKAP